MISATLRPIEKASFLLFLGLLLLAIARGISGYILACHRGMVIVLSYVSVGGQRNGPDQKTSIINVHVSIPATQYPEVIAHRQASREIGEAWLNVSTPASVNLLMLKIIRFSFHIHLL